ncbi:phosphate ABC transporter substrate-binding protein [Streptococcaceae bacterium ESL0687]|nr:phosphate ABC transporter substrate-binding protein [Streptococcaceae bacterium ESL0687]
MKKSIKLAGLLTISLMGLAACGSKTSGQTANDEQIKITAAGSTALQPLVESASEGFMEKNSGSQITVQGGGSGFGLSNVQNGAVQIGNSDLFAEEKDGIDASSLVDYKVAVVGIVPIAHKDSGVENLTSAQLKDIFTGKITNWKEVGGADQAITVINRAEGSGTRFNFEKYGLGEGVKVIKSQEQDSSGAAVKMVEQIPGAISYVALSNIKNSSVTPLSIDKVQANEENIEKNEWKIWAYEHMYTLKAKETDGEKKFIQYVADSHDAIEKLGYLPVDGMKVVRDAEGKVTDK